jgi:sensor histidine kinase YesM
LLENAVNHAFKGVDYKGLIELNHELSKNHLNIIVSDNGVGIGSSKIMTRKISWSKKLLAIIYKQFLTCTEKPITIDFISNNGTTVILRIPKLNPKRLKKTKEIIIYSWGLNATLFGLINNKGVFFN